jgi:capsular exopolysaccharide synthesis family protein
VTLAAILGLVAGIVLVLILDRFDGRIRTSQVAQRAFGTAVMAEVPALSRRERRRRPIAVLGRPRSATADAFRTLALQLSMPRVPPPPGGTGLGNGHTLGAGNGDASGAGAPPKVVLVASAGPADGKTTVAANLAVAFAHRGRRCLVLSCDFRRPKIHRLFGASNEDGFAAALTEGAERPLLRPYVRATDVDRLWVVPCGPPPLDPSELLSSPYFRVAMEEARQVADVVVVDTAPLLTTSDAADLVALSDVVVVVARAGRTTTDVAERTTELLARLGARVAGVVLNAATEMSVPRRYYYYRYYRAPRDARPVKRSPSRREKPQLVGHSAGE